MLFYSTNKQSEKVSFKDATLLGQARDKGLYFPEKIPGFSESFLKNLKNYSKEAIAFETIQPFIEEEIPKKELEKIISETIAFDFPLVEVKPDIFSLELYHGPTLAFKDVGARFMSRCLGHFAKGKKEKVVVLVATSGDTGGAVADGFYGVENVEVVILYPKGKVSSVQEKQLTTHGKNIHALEVNGTFDDCQALVKQAFTEQFLNKKIFLTSANSINVARWLPQQFFYLSAFQQWKDDSQTPVISVPSGNFGNICAGLLTYQRGLPVKQFIAACNANDVLSSYFETGTYHSKKATPTISNAMDVGDPSNLVRILEMFSHSLTDLKKILSSCTISDPETKAAVKKVYSSTNYLLDPHGAVAFAALEKYIQLNKNDSGIFLETAHPVKFPESIEEELQLKIEVPDRIKGLFQKEKKSVEIEVEFEALKSYLTIFS